MAAKTIFWYCVTGSIFFRVKRSVSDSKIIRQINSQKRASESSKVRENKCWVHRTPLGHLSAKFSF